MLRASPGRTPVHPLVADATRPWRQPPQPGHPVRSLAAPQLALAFDFGLKRIGIAAGDTLTATASPRPAVLVSRSGPDWAAIGREVLSLKPGRLVVGAPYNADGTAGALLPKARRFANELKSRFALPVSLVDERFSSLEASAVLTTRRAAGGRRTRHADIDSTAAAVILERWLSGERGEEL